MFAIESLVRHCRAMVLMPALMMYGCGGGKGEDAASSQTAPLNVALRATQQSDLQIAQSVYGSAPRTPPGFQLDLSPAGFNFVTTAHVKNTDVDPRLSAPQPQYELCTDDWSEALEWSESSARNASQYSLLMATDSEPRFWEFGRERQGEPGFYVRSRVYKCTYLDRSAANLRAEQGLAGHFNQRPLSASELRTLSEYLWQFTRYNNVGHAVLKSSGAPTANGLSHTLIIASLARNGSSGTCDRVDVSSWRHDLDTATGTLELETELLWSFSARESFGVAQLCAQ